MEALYDVYAWPSICLYFIYARKIYARKIYARKIYVRTYGKITRQWKSTYSLQKCPPIRSDAWLINQPTLSRSIASLLSSL